jgi:hypothetical protein
MNESKSMVLCKKVTVSKNIPMGTKDSGNLPGGGANVQLMVITIKENKVLYEKSIAYGSAEWENDETLRIIEIMGANLANNPNIYLYNVLTKSRTQLNNGKEGTKIEKH